MAVEVDAAGADLLGGGVLGADTSAPMTVARWTTLRQARPFQFAIIECYKPKAGALAHAKASVEAAWTAGLAAVDVYHFPSPARAVPPDVQIAASLAVLGGAPFGRMWFDVEPYPYTWSTNIQQNRELLGDLINAARRAGREVGIYTTGHRGVWDRLMGHTTAFSRFPLWNYRWDGRADVSNFQPFGGWQAPTIKQYAGNCQIDGVEYDANWRPTG